MGKYLSTLRSSQGYEKHEFNEKTVQDAKTHAPPVTKKEQPLEAVPNPQSFFVTPLAVETPSSTAISLNSSISYQGEEKTQSTQTVTTVTLEQETLDQLMLLEALVWSGQYEGVNVEELKAYLWRWFERGDEDALQPLLAYLEREDVQGILRSKDCE
jgi:hypothetical protein